MNRVFFVRKKKISIYEEENSRGKIFYFVLLFSNLSTLFKNGFKARPIEVDIRMQYSVQIKH